MKVKCPQCDGKGEYKLAQKWEGKNIIVPVKCTMCDGTGKVEKSMTYTGIRK